MTKRVLLTAFEPYGSWPDNSSLRCLAELTRSLEREPLAGLSLATRIYPVDFPQVRLRLAEDLAVGIDVAIHLGQSPGATAILLEEVAVNLGSTPGEASCRPLEGDAPLAYRSDLPLDDWAARLRQAGIPARVSYHAGTYLCNAALFWSLHLSAKNGWPTRSVFVHLPFDLPQAIAQPKDVPALPSAVTAVAVRCLLEWLGEAPA
jgi:pyroglutamyl-peptidase